MYNEITKDLTALATQINREHQEAEAAATRSLQHVRRAGELLTQVKAQVGHGGWGPWLEQHFEGSARTAQTYMRIASRFEELESKTQRVADLPLREALALLAEPREADPELGAEDTIPTRYFVRTSDWELETDLLSFRGMTVVDRLAKVYGRGSPPPFGYTTWHKFVLAEVLTPTGLGQPFPADMSVDEWRDIISAMIEFMEAGEAQAA